jgi:hypothetical protein
MWSPFSILFATVFLACGLVLLDSIAVADFQATNSTEVPPSTYLGFDRNIYPGDAALGSLRQTFSFCGYWLNAPPGETSNTWNGKREVLASRGFGFLVLFNGRLDRQLKSQSNARMLGTRDATEAVEAAKKEEFPSGTVIFLDQEEGGRMLPEQQAYIYSWIDSVNTSRYRAGVYCSGIPASETGGTKIITANDLRENATGREIAFWVYNDSCPPSPGCTFPRNPPSPQESGVPFARVWQFAQSPRRRKITANCPSHYDSNGNCYAPFLQPADGLYIDIDSAESPDPSSGRL